MSTKTDHLIANSGVHAPSRVVDAAVAEVQSCSELFRMHQAEINAAKIRVQRAAKAYLDESASEADLVDRAARLYWNYPLVNVSTIAGVLIGDEKKNSQVSKLIPPRATEINCPACGKKAERVFQSRMAMKDFVTSKWASDALCTACGLKAAEERQEENAQHLEMLAARADELRTMPYGEYLKTPEWLDTRMRKLRSARFRCQACNSGGRLDVHHRTYERRGDEDWADLIVLCRPCHAKFHDKEV